VSFFSTLIHTLQSLMHYSYLHSLYLQQGTRKTNEGDWRFIVSWASSCPVIAQLPDIDKRDFLSSRAAESGFGPRWKKNLFGPPVRADWQNIFTVHLKDWLSVVQWLGIWPVRTSLPNRQALILPRKTKTQAKLSSPPPLRRRCS